MDQLTFLSEVRPASPLVSQGFEEDLLTLEATSHSSLLLWLRGCVPAGLFGRMSLESCRSKTDGHLELSSESWGNAGMGSPTGFLTLSISERPNAVAECSLSAILETGDLPLRYFLSAKACIGIINRAKRRGKTIPQKLHAAMINTIRERNF